jgi:lipopolysaccharide export system permease protein
VLAAAPAMTLLDRYIGRIVLGAFVATLVFFMFLVTLLDLLNNLPGYANRAAEHGLGTVDLAVQLGGYYLRFLPVVFTLVTPFATVIACMFAVARLQHANEVVPMLFVGRSIHRVLRPMFALGIGAGLAMAACWQWVVPQFGSDLAAAEAFLKEGTRVQSKLVDESRADQFFYAREFDPANATLTDVNMLVEGTLAADFVLTTAPSARWVDEVGDWQLANGRILRWQGNDRIESPHEWLGRPDLTPPYLLQQSRQSVDPDAMSYDELVEVIAARPNRASLRMALHRHITYPLANVLLLLLVLPLAVHFERGTRVSRVLASIGLCAAYLLVDLTCQRLGERNLIHPVVAAWTPTIVFGALGVVMFQSTKT